MSLFRSIRFLGIVALFGCAQTRNGFVPCNDINAYFFHELVSLSHQKPSHGMGFEQIDSVRVFRTAFREREVAHGNVLEYQEVPELSPNGKQYLEFQGYSQELYLFQLFTQPVQSNAFVYFSIKFDADSQSIGFGPAYFGRYTNSHQKSRIQFFRRLKMDVHDQTFSLKKSGKERGLYFYFSPSQTTGTDSVSDLCFTTGLPTRLEAIVNSDFNKIAGDKALIISTDQLFKDPAALLFRYRKTLDFTKSKKNK